MKHVNLYIFLSMLCCDAWNKCCALQKFVFSQLNTVLQLELLKILTSYKTKHISIKYFTCDASRSPITMATTQTAANTEHLNFHLKRHLSGRKCSRADTMFCMYTHCVPTPNRIRLRKYRNFHILASLDLEMTDVTSVNPKSSPAKQIKMTSCTKTLSIWWLLRREHFSQWHYFKKILQYIMIGHFPWSALIMKLNQTQRF